MRGLSGLCHFLVETLWRRLLLSRHLIPFGLPVLQSACALPFHVFFFSFCQFFFLLIQWLLWYASQSNIARRWIVECLNRDLCSFVLTSWVQIARCHFFLSFLQCRCSAFGFYVSCILKNFLFVFANARIFSSSIFASPQPPLINRDKTLVVFRTRVVVFYQIVSAKVRYCWRAFQRTCLLEKGGCERSGR